ncbi:hypothetical protein [Kordia sp.]|uniref:hypothetical protein n=1 Tax=Kordia sp. TaxID=1965332 RepID=UPI003B59125D
MFLIVFVFSFSLNAQTEISIFDQDTNTKNVKFYQIENYSQLFSTKTSLTNFTINVSDLKKPFFEKYNYISAVNDIYSNTNNDVFTYVKSTYNIENMNRGVKIDSYNPLGISPNGTSVLFGVFGVVLDKLQK